MALTVGEIITSDDVVASIANPENTFYLDATRRIVGINSIPNTLDRVTGSVLRKGILGRLVSNSQISSQAIQATQATQDAEIAALQQQLDEAEIIARSDTLQPGETIALAGTSFVAAGRRWITLSDDASVPDPLTVAALNASGDFEEFTVPTSQPFGDAQISVRALDLFANREVIQQTGGDFGIYTNRFHLSDEPAVVGNLQGKTITFQRGVPKDLYLIGPTVRGPGETIDQTNNGTITGIHYRVTFDGQSFDYEVIDSQRNHPTTLPGGDDAYLQVAWNDQAGLENFDGSYAPPNGNTFNPEILFSGLAISTPPNQYLVDERCFLTSPIDVDDRTGLSSGGDTPFTFFDNNPGTDVTYVASRAGTLTGFRMNLRNASTTDYSIDAIVRNATTGSESAVTFSVPAGDAFGAADNEVILTTGLQTSIGDNIEFEFSGGSADVIQRNTNDTENVFNWAFSGPINNPSMGVIYRDEVVVRWFEDDSIRYSVLGSTVAVELPNCLLYTSPSPRDATLSRMPSSA